MPRRLHHYTDAAGLLGIIQSRTLWATDCRFLNDSTEYVYARAALAEALNHLPNPALDPAHHLHHIAAEVGDEIAKLGKIVNDGVDNDFRVAVTCFCEEGDLLSQWRGYAPNHGYSIEFDHDTLDAAAQAVASVELGELRRIEYGPAAIAELAALAAAGVSSDNLNHPGVHGYHHALQLAANVASVKHEGFAEEREWRLVLVQYAHNDATQILFRPTPIAVVPYMRVPIDPAAICSIRVGPGDKTAIRVEGIRRLLAASGSAATVEVSAVPLRT